LEQQWDSVPFKYSVKKKWGMKSANARTRGETGKGKIEAQKRGGSKVRKAFAGSVVRSILNPPMRNKTKTGMATGIRAQGAGDWEGKKLGRKEHGGGSGRTRTPENLKTGKGASCPERIKQAKSGNPLEVEKRGGRIRGQEERKDARTFSFKALASHTENPE